VADPGARQRHRTETWIKESYNKAIAKASDDDRAMALQMLEHWVPRAAAIDGVFLKRWLETRRD
jgi:hypothetical protein